jgi:hypothetical protein
MLIRDCIQQVFDADRRPSPNFVEQGFLQFFWCALPH